MSAYHIIGIMTGNSMDAMDLVLSEFKGHKIKDICSYSKPYNTAMQKQCEVLRSLVLNKSRFEIEQLPLFTEFHDKYIRLLAEAVNEMCLQNNINKNSVDAIGFHGKTLDHNPPSRALLNNNQAYTLQIGSGQMLADLTGIKVVYDFRSPLIMSGFEGAPLIAPHNAHLSQGKDVIFFNGGNTSNFALISKGQTLLNTDAGPFNEYIDNFIRNNTTDAFDVDGKYGSQGKLIFPLIAQFFNICSSFYRQSLPKSGDPAYYNKEKIFEIINNEQIAFHNAVYSLEYFAAYIAAYALSLIPDNIPLPRNIMLFGGGWKNPIILQSFKDILAGHGHILDEHKNQFSSFLKRLKQPLNIRFSDMGKFMEARLFADMAFYRLENKVWELPEIIKSGQHIICGQIAIPQTMNNTVYTDKVSLAAKGWK